MRGGIPAVPDHPIASTHDFRAYVAWSLNTRGEGAVLANHQVQFLSDAAYRTQAPRNWRATPADLKQASALLQNLPAFGLVRRFAQSCRLFNSAYRPALPAVFFHDRSENSTHTAFQTEAEVLSEIRGDLGEATYESLCAANTLDLALYATANRLFDMKLQHLYRPAARLTLPVRVFAGRLRQKLMATGGGLGSAKHPLEPAYVRLPPAPSGT